MLTVVLFAAVLLSILGVLLGKAGIIYLVRPGPTVTYVRCALLEWATFALSVAGSLLLVTVDVTAGARDALRRAACMVVIAGSELVTALLLFGVVSLLAGVIVLAVAWRRHLAHALLAALLADLTMTGVLLATTILLISPAPFLTLWQAPAERAGRSTACYPPRPPAWPVPPQRPDTNPPVTTGRDLAPAAQRAVTFLYGQYDAQVGLLRESPSVAPHTYWLASDNLLAWHALTAAGQVTLTAQLDAALAGHRRPMHGLVDIPAGQIVSWPPYVETRKHVATTGSAEIWC